MGLEHGFFAALPTAYGRLAAPSTASGAIAWP
jgi:hypothetical protein